MSRSRIPGRLAPQPGGAILFVGNSFTARNNLLAVLTGLAKQRGLRFEHRLIQAGGASLRQHLDAGTVAAALADGTYDTVVLQEQSTLPGINAKRMRSGRRGAFRGGRRKHPTRDGFTRVERTWPACRRQRPDLTGPTAVRSSPVSSFGSAAPSRVSRGTGSTSGGAVRGSSVPSPLVPADPTDRRRGRPVT